MVRPSAGLLVTCSLTRRNAPPDEKRVRTEVHAVYRDTRILIDDDGGIGSITARVVSKSDAVPTLFLVCGGGILGSDKNNTMACWLF